MIGSIRLSASCVRKPINSTNDKYPCCFQEPLSESKIDANIKYLDPSVCCHKLSELRELRQANSASICTVNSLQRPRGKPAAGARKKFAASSCKKLACDSHLTAFKYSQIKNDPKPPTFGDYSSEQIRRGKEPSRALQQKAGVMLCCHIIPNYHGLRRWFQKDRFLLKQTWWPGKSTSRTLRD